MLLGSLALASILALSLFLVLMAANRPSLLSPTTHIGYFPRWMAGPLGGLLPGFTNNGTALKLLFTGGVLLMYGGYVIAIKRRPRAARAVGDRGDRGGPCDLPAVPTAGPHGPVQLCQLRAHGGCTQPQPIYVDPDSGATQRSELSAQQLARAAEPLRPTVHAADVRRGSTGCGGLVLGAEGHFDGREPGPDLARVEMRAAAWP